MIGIALYHILPDYLDKKRSAAVAFEDLKKENEEIIAWLRFDDADDLHISYLVLYSWKRI